MKLAKSFTFKTIFGTGNRIFGQQYFGDGLFQKNLREFFRPIFDKNTYFSHGRMLNLSKSCHKRQPFKKCTTVLYIVYYSIFSPKISHKSALESCRLVFEGPSNINLSRVKNQVSICFLSRMTAF